MKTKVGYSAMLFTFTLLVVIIFGGPVLGQEQRPTISLAERAYEMLAVQNTYSKHAYYHAYPQLYCQELEDIWVSEDGPYAKTAKWTNPQGIQEGMALIKKNYCTANMESVKKSLEEISKIYPEIENVPENLGAGTGYTIHTQTTPIIEVAGDGKTAKGLWYSPGISTNTVIVDGKAETRGNWFMEKYAVDFVKEDGEWKIWHVGMYYDPTPPEWGTEAPMQEGGGGQSLEMSRPNPNPYESWTPKSVLKLAPRFPEPYYTFSETFSY